MAKMGKIKETFKAMWVLSYIKKSVADQIKQVLYI